MKIMWNDAKITGYVTSVTWAGSAKQAARTVAFSVAYSPNDKNVKTLGIKLGDKIVFYPGYPDDKKTKFVGIIRFLYKGIIIKHNKTEPTYTKTSLFLCEKRRFLWPGLRKEGNLFKLAGPGGLAFFHLTKKEVSKWPMKK